CGLRRRFAPRNDEKHTMSFRGGPQDRTRNLEVPGSRFARPGMTAQLTELLNTTSISFAPGLLNASVSFGFSSAGSVILMASNPIDFAKPEKSTRGSPTTI